MACACYLAITAAEIANAPALPERLAWMACHFSSCDAGLSNRPTQLPAGAMLILDDQMPVAEHDITRIADQMRSLVGTFGVDAVLLDFQRPNNAHTAAVARALVESLTCPVGVSDLYAAGLSCPVFLPPVPPYCKIEPYLAQWGGREIWLEAALSGANITLTDKGAAVSDCGLAPSHANAHHDEALFCHYTTTLSDDKAEFRLFRTQDDLLSLLAHADTLGVKRCIGLYQELGDSEQIRSRFV